MLPNVKLTDDEERAADAQLEHAVARAPRHSVQRLVGCFL